MDWPELHAYVFSGRTASTTMGARRGDVRQLSRSSYGVGSIYRRKSDGMWCAALFTGGRQKYLYAKTRHEAMAKLRAAQVELGANRLPQQRSPKLQEFLHLWLETSVRPRVRPLTYAGYKVNVDKHLVPSLGNIRVDQITPLHVQEMINDRLRAGLSPKTVAYVHQVLRSALSAAVRWDIVSRNVAKLVDRPRIERKPINPLTPDEARKFLSAIKGHRLEALFSVALALGLRQGEALGLQWEDLDFASATLRVRHQLQRIDGRLTLVPPKTSKSRRVLVMPPLIVDGLR